MPKVGRVLAGLISSNARLRTLEKITEQVLWKRTRAEAEDHLELAPTLPPERLVGAKLYSDRLAMLHALPRGGVVGEIGTWRGEFSALIAETCRPETFYLFDLDFGPLVEPQGNLVKHLGDSAESLGKFPPCTFDWIYVDGDHSYSGVVRDLAAVHRALKPGGHIMCNDYTNWCSPAVTPYGVARAVNEMVIAEKYAVAGLALHPAGLHDILIRKPAL